MEEYPHFYGRDRELQKGCIGKLLKPPVKPARKTRVGSGAPLVRKSCLKDTLEATEGMSKDMSKLEQNDCSRGLTQGSSPLPSKDSKQFWNKREDAGTYKDRK